MDETGTTLKSISIYCLFTQNTRLKRQLTQGRDAAFTEVQLRNQFLTEKLGELEQHMQAKAMDSQARISVRELDSCIDSFCGAVINCFAKYTIYKL